MPRPLRVGLALSSGGARGFAHVGVIKGLHAAGCTITAVAGSSIGAIIAAGYAIHADADALERWVLDFRARDYARGRVPIMDPARLTAFLDRTFGGAAFADCAVPLRIVATDLVARVAVTLDSGPLANAAFASSTLPFFHRPVVWGERLLADGSLSCVLPLAQATVPGIDLVVGSLVSRPRAALNGLTSGLARTAGGVVRGWGRPYVDFFRARAATPLARRDARARRPADPDPRPSPRPARRAGLRPDARGDRGGRGGGGGGAAGVAHGE